MRAIVPHVNGCPVSLVVKSDCESEELMWTEFPLYKGKKRKQSLDFLDPWVPLLSHSFNSFHLRVARTYLKCLLVTFWEGNIL